MKKTTKTEKETKEVAKTLAKQIRSESDIDRAAVVALVGDLGAGKTVFVRGFSEALGVKERITSPTFVILKRFKIQDLRFKNLIHVDAYRMEDAGELKELGWEGIVNNPKNIILIEWAENIKKTLKKPYFLINFDHKEENKRTIDIKLIK